MTFHVLFVQKCSVIPAQSRFPPDFLPVTAGQKKKVVRLCSCSFMLNNRAKLCLLAFAVVLLTVLSHLLCYPIMSFFLLSLLDALSVPLLTAPGRGRPQPQLSDVGQVQCGDSGNSFGGGSQQARACSHCILPFPGPRPAPEGSVSRGLAQNCEINGISLKGNTIFHLDHLISAVWLANIANIVRAGA